MLGIRQKTHFNRYVSDFRKFARIIGVSYLIESDLGILHLEAKDWGNVYQFPRKQADRIPVSILETWGPYVPDPSRDLAERLSAWPPRVAAAAGLRRGDLLNTAPPTTVLMKEGLIGFAEKQNHGKV